MNDTITTSEASRKAENTTEIWNPVFTILTTPGLNRSALDGYRYGSNIGGNRQQARIALECRIEEGKTTDDFRCRLYGAGNVVEADHFVRNNWQTSRAAIHFVGFVEIRTSDSVRLTRVEIDRAMEGFRRQVGFTETVIRREANAAVDVVAGSYFTLEINQGKREAEVLAVIGAEALVEYTMPAGTSALHIMKTKTSRAELRAHPGGTSISYAKLPIRWIEAATVQAGVWVANPQSGDRYPENIGEALAFRAEKKAAAKAAKAERDRQSAEWKAKNAAEEKDLAEKNAADAAECQRAIELLD